MKSVFCFLLLLLGATAYAQEATAPKKDISRIDFTALPDFDANNVSFRGLYLGMSKEEAIQKLNSFKEFTWKYDDFNTLSRSASSPAQMRIYVDMKDKAGLDDPAVLYLQWEEGVPGMHAMVFYKALAPMLAGNAKKLFTPDALKEDCNCRKALKGTPVKETDDIGINTYSFPKQHLSLISMGEPGSSESVWFKFTED